MDITITIPNAKVPDFKAGFLKRYPVPLNEEGLPAMTEAQWLKTWIIQRLRFEYVEGKKQLAADAAVLEENEIT
jgi:hypothetical protein